MDIIGKKYIFLSFSGLLVVASITAVMFFGLKQGIDFAGGTVWQLRGDKLNQVIIQSVLPSASISYQQADNSYVLRLPSLSEVEHKDIFKKLTNSPAGNAIEELRYETIGSAIGKELRSKAIWAFVFVLLGISLYIAFAFRKVSRPVSSWKYGVITLVTLFHDAIIPIGLMAVMGNFFHAELDTNFIVAILVVIGFSVHDTIVVFDRIRENLKNTGGKVISDFNGLVNKSINETFARSINTSLTLLIVLLALLLFSAPSLFYFILVILVGTIFGTYSSIFIASPLLTLINRD